MNAFCVNGTFLSIPWIIFCDGVRYLWLPVGGRRGRWIFQRFTIYLNGMRFTLSYPPRTRAVWTSMHRAAGIVNEDIYHFTWTSAWRGLCFTSGLSVWNTCKAYKFLICQSKWKKKYWYGEILNGISIDSVCFISYVCASGKIIII